MEQELFRQNPYLKTLETRVIGKLGDGLILDETIFYPEGGGQPGDMGMLFGMDGSYLPIVNTLKTPEGILHITDQVNNKITLGDNVKIEVDWERRYKHMRMHTALHILCSLVKGAVTGGSIGITKSRLDFDIPGERPEKESLTSKLMEIVLADYPVTTSWITDQELEANPSLVRTMSVKPPKGSGHIRMVRIGADIDFQPCGGTHVKSTGEIGKIKIGKIENKGKQNRRINVTWAD
ncbi:MAG: Ala-tRNA(Pro) hydrolase [Rhodospirillaceae bacterium]|nr:Ala-tRNA(Pro) hydrolase [Rhodospirillaceae bacterium]